MPPIEVGLQILPAIAPIAIPIFMLVAILLHLIEARRAAERRRRQAQPGFQWKFFDE